MRPHDLSSVPDTADARLLRTSPSTRPPFGSSPQDSNAESSQLHDAEAGELGAGVNDDAAARYWGTGAGKLELPEGCIQLAWLIINDSYRADTLCLVYPPHLVAIAALQLALVLHADTRRLALGGDDAPRRSSRTRRAHTTRAADAVAFLAGLSVNMREVAAITQEMLALYRLWAKFKDEGSEAEHKSGVAEGERQYTTRELVDILQQMRDERERDVAHPATGRPVQQTKMLERAQSGLVSGWRA